MKKKIKTISVLFILSIGIVLLLFAKSKATKNDQNSFVRLFPPHPILESDQLDLKFGTYYLAGQTHDKFYFGNNEAALHMVVTDRHLADSQHIQLKIKNITKYKFHSIKVDIDSPNYFFTDGFVPATFRGNIENWTGEKINIDSTYFNYSVPIGKNSFAIRSLSPQLGQYVLMKKNSNNTITPANNILQKQIDGMFCVDGMMHYNRELNKIIYVYFYRNEFICADTSLNLLYRGHTIDTISKAQIKVSKINSENKYTMSAPPLTVNKISCTWSKWLFINSNLIAKNENKKAFESSSAIDVYDVESAKYLFSFYIPNLYGKKMRNFKVANNKLVTFHDHYAVTYDLNPQFFK